MISILIPSTGMAETSTLSEEVERLFPDAQIIMAHDRYRKGKGWAMREALSLASGEIIVFLDGDGDIHPDMINRLLPHLREFDIVVGKKDTRGLLSRYIVTMLSRIYIKLLFGIGVDTQTGIKVFDRDHLPEWKTNGFAFDIEILAKAKRNGAKLFEVTIDAKVNKPMNLKSIIKTLVETWRVSTDR